MIKSNSKEARRAVEAYVMSCVQDINERMEQENSLRPVTAAFNTLSDEMSYQSDYDGNRAIMGKGLAAKYIRAGRYNFITANNPYWVWFLACKAGCFDVSYYDMREHVARWLQETPAEASKYSNEEVEQTYRHLSALAFERLNMNESEPHRVSTSEFASLLAEHQPDDNFFSRDTLKYYNQTRKDIKVEGFYLITDNHGKQRDCYRVESKQHDPWTDAYRIQVYYFDRVTLKSVHTA